MNMLSPFDRAKAREVELAPGTATPAKTPSRWRRRALIGLPIALVVAGGYVLSTRDNAAVAAPPLPVVTVAAPLVREITEWDDYVGRFEASRAVEVRPRVSGQLVGVHFTDGQIVRKGQLLFTIDARPFNAALAEARADAASARSDLELARVNLARANRLIADEAVSQSDLDQLNARVRAASAALAAADARVRSRSLDVEFTQVRAPIGGRISDRRVDSGNLVAAGEGAGGSLLTTINALDPIYFNFDSSEALFLKAQRERQAGGAAAQQVEIRLQDESDYRWKGRVDFSDNAINANSGTLRVRAVIDNPGNFLTPGMFGNMRLAQGGTVSALLVPDAAVRTDQARKQLFVVGKDGTVAARPVETGPLVAGLRVIRSGLKAGDRVVVQGIQFAQPGAKVTAKPTTIQPKAAPAAPVGASQPPAASQATLTP
ncbi:efflux transporter periplasmic adaptor subunit [Sphingopyxis sp. QXT-31]|uniref:efflux RND transporter periplasmic adaptor subunit n=1 Tax=Sphingopyxis sp. QXT-31 TaxID=1357916 RepID=UPI00097905A3|nr:efflux RND transporter periplasmic adaptor subunit [Sphingopyxis sp. QXT-31]APZ97200.1 efflux transporter periplasmic adaptor subunit [Sphingopyxis sp. QXT-31]